MTDHYDDRYDGHDEYDDELGPIDEGYGEPDAAGQVHNAYVGDAQTLLKRAIDIVASNRHTRDGFAVRNVFLDVPEQLQDVPVPFDVAQPDSRTRRRDGLPSQ